MGEVVFNTFNDVDHVPLRVYNRVVTANNIMEDYGKNEVLKYYENFNDIERTQMIAMMQFIKQHGYEAGKAFATKDFTPSEDYEKGIN